MLVVEQLTERRRRRAEREEDQREAENEQQRVDERRAPGFLHVLEAQSRDERHVARDERQYAG